MRQFVARLIRPPTLPVESTYCISSFDGALASLARVSFQYIWRSYSDLDGRQLGLSATREAAQEHKPEIGEEFAAITIDAYQHP